MIDRRNIIMNFLSEKPDIEFKKPIIGMVIGNSVLSTIPGLSAAGATPESTLMTPALDAFLIQNGPLPGMDIPLSPLGCATPATVTRAMLELCGLDPVIVNAGLAQNPITPCYDVYGAPGQDPRVEDAIKDPERLYEFGRRIGKQLSEAGDLLVLGESVPGGTTTALCVLRGLGYSAGVSSSYSENPHSLKNEICDAALGKINSLKERTTMDVIRIAGDPMMPVVAGISKGYTGTLVLSGGTQMLAVAALIKHLGDNVPPIVTTEYVRADKSAEIEKAAEEIGIKAWFVDPDFGNIGDESLARYCGGEVKEGALLAGSMWLAYMTGHSKEEIWAAIKTFLENFGK